MAIVQVNPPGMAATAPGYISSITIRNAGVDTPYVPNATTGQITLTDPLAATKLVQDWAQMKLISG